MSSFEWAREQLRDSDLDLEEQTDVVRLLSVWEQMVFTADDPRRAKILDTFVDLANGVALEKDDPEFMWLPATKVRPRQKDRIRVRRDAFPKGTNHALNGKTGIVARVSRGTLVIALDDMPGSVHVSPDKLETQVPKTD